MRGPRRLISLRREVAAAEDAEYAALWQALAAEVEARGAHAWRFTAADRPELRLEFLEFAAGADPRSAPAVADALRDLDQRIGAAAVEVWDGGA